VFSNHPVAKGKLLRLPQTIPDLSFTTDFPLLMRVIDNMLKNAFEATVEGGEVKVSIEQGQDEITFCVWNQQAIPKDIAKRVFQRNFSTKKDVGRGLGTYSMKLFGEQFLGGRVNFTTSETDGTVFCFSLNV
jgi:signal transduction histidine kinase